MADQHAAIPVTDKMLKAWSLMADASAEYMRPGEANWVMMVRSLIAEISRLKTGS